MIRYFFEGWQSFAVQPRFIERDGELVLVASPYNSLDEEFSDNRVQISDTLRAHLKNYDEFYSDALYYKIPYVDELKLADFLRLAIDSLSKMISPTDRDVALSLQNSILKKMQQESYVSGAQFTMFLLPTIEDLRDMMEHTTDVSPIH